MFKSKPDAVVSNDRESWKSDCAASGAGLKYLIVHADDLGMAHSVNEATFAAFEQGAITSASVMVPCAWFPEASEYARKHPEIDLGLHLTLTSEWKSYRWSSVAPTEMVRSLHDPDGYFWNSSTAVAKMGDPEEVELELSHQLMRAVRMGIQPSHIDSHMFSLLMKPSLFAAYVRLGRKHKIPFLSVRDSETNLHASAILKADDIVLNTLFLASPGTRPENWKDAYAQQIRSLKPGLNQLTVHLGFPDSELVAMTANRSDWDAAWRLRDFQFVTSTYFKELIEENEIHLTSWKDLGNSRVPLLRGGSFMPAPFRAHNP
jgi:predicted glycoside hydrolase/deacetylase ChbG (UPF0249 family)